MGIDTAGKLEDNNINENSTTLEHLQAETIEGVIDSLDKIVEWSKANQKRTGYFAALYRKVTKKIKEGIDNNEFDNAERMERLDVIFANRYLAAFEQYYTAQETNQAWDLAFKTSEKWEPIVLLHLMVGMNAHINLDLGIAAAQTVSPTELPNLKSDFDKINHVLSSLVDEVQNELAQIWPLFKLIDKFAGRLDENLADISMKIARNQAWRLAEEFASCNTEQQTALIKKTDCAVFLLGKLATNPNFRLRLLFLLIRIGEGQNVEKIIKVLE